MAALAHVLGLLFWVIGPLVVLLITDDEFVEQNARNAINWQIFFTVYMTISGILTLVLIGLLLVPIVLLIDVVFCVLAAVKASNGETWKYPLTIDLV